MFKSYEFTFAGESSAMYGLMVYDFDGVGQSDVAFGNKASIVETRTNTRIQPLHFGVNYHEKPLEFTLVFGSLRDLDRYELEVISLWLTGHQNYQWLSIDQPDMERVQFRCLISQLKPISHGWLPVAFEATITCDCPYAYGFPFEEEYVISDTGHFLFRNDSSVREYIYPQLTFVPTEGTTELRIVNHNDSNREFVLTGIPSGVRVDVNNKNGIIVASAIDDEDDDTISNVYNLYDGFNLNFLRLVQGDNLLTIIGDGTLIISGRLLYNVAG